MYILYFKLSSVCSQWAKSPKMQSVGVYFWQYGTVFWFPN